MNVWGREHDVAKYVFVEGRTILSFSLYVLFDAKLIEILVVFDVTANITQANII